MDKDLEFALRMAVQCLNAGFSFDDTMAYLDCFEEVNPEVDEDVGIARARALEKKYGVDAGGNKLD